MVIEQVPAASIAAMIITAIIAIGLPIGLMIANRIKNHAAISSFFIGCGVFVVAALILEQIVHLIVFQITGDFLTGNSWLYGLYGGLAAAVFEETGRLLAMKVFLKKQLEEKNALMYGIGHGGAEAILIVGLSYISNIVTAFMINTGALEKSLGMLDETMTGTVVESVSALWTLPASQFYLAGLERVFAIGLQISFSLLMYYAVKDGKRSLLAAVYGLHFAVDFVTVVAANYVDVIWVEVLLAIMTIGIVIFTNSYRKKQQAL